MVELAEASSNDSLECARHSTRNTHKDVGVVVEHVHDVDENTSCVNESGWCAKCRFTAVGWWHHRT